VTRLLDPPRPVTVRLDSSGTPCYLQAHPLVGDLQAEQSWVVDVDWWSNPVRREYWRVLLRGSLLCEVFRDLDQDAWFLERVYD
jgi:hypothetical protein